MDLTEARRQYAEKLVTEIRAELSSRFTKLYAEDFSPNSPRRLNKEEFRKELEDAVRKIGLASMYSDTLKEIVCEWLAGIEQLANQEFIEADVETLIEKVTQYIDKKP